MKSAAGQTNRANVFRRHKLAKKRVLDADASRVSVAATDQVMNDDKVPI